jgi:integrase
VLSFAEAKAEAMVATTEANGEQANGKIEKMTVRQAMARYIDYMKHKGKPVRDLNCRSNAHILPTLGNLVISKLTAEQLQRWLATMAAAPAQVRPKQGKPQYKPAPATHEDVRRRQVTANRVLTMLKAALNHAYDEGQVERRDAWGRRLAPFENVDVARVRYLSIAEADRLINACAPDFRQLVRAGLESGCRYGQLIQLEVCDFNRDAGTLTVRKS